MPRLSWAPRTRSGPPCCDTARPTRVQDQSLRTGWSSRRRSGLPSRALRWDRCRRCGSPRLLARRRQRFQAPRRRGRPSARAAARKGRCCARHRSRPPRTGCSSRWLRIWKTTSRCPRDAAVSRGRPRCRTCRHRRWGRAGRSGWAAPRRPWRHRLCPKQTPRPYRLRPCLRCRRRHTRSAAPCPPAPRHMPAARPRHRQCRHRRPQPMRRTTRPSKAEVRPRAARRARAPNEDVLHVHPRRDFASPPRPRPVSPSSPDPSRLPSLWLAVKRLRFKDILKSRASCACARVKNV